MKKYQLLWDDGFGNSLKSSTAMGSKNLFSTGSFVLNKDRILWKNEIQKESTHSDLHFVLFHFDTLSGSKDTNTEALLLKHHSCIIQFKLQYFMVH